MLKSRLQGTVCFVFLLDLEGLAAGSGPGAVCDTTWEAKTRDADIRHRQPPSSRVCFNATLQKDRMPVSHPGAWKSLASHSSSKNFKLTRSRGAESPRGGSVWSGQMGRYQRGCRCPYDGNSPRRTSASLTAQHNHQTRQLHGSEGMA